MALKSRKKKFKSKIYSMPVLILLVIIFALLINSVVNVYRKEKDSEKYVSESQRELAVLLTREKFLESKIDSLNTVEGREIEIREKFNVVKDGEKVIIIIEDENSTSLDSVDNRNWFFKAKDFLIGLWGNNNF